MRFWLSTLFVFLHLFPFAQETDSLSDFSTHSISAFAGQTFSRIERLDVQAKTATDKMLAKMQKQEANLAKKVQSKDSLLHSRVFANSAQFYQRLKEKLNTAADTNQVAELNEYIPYLDTLKTSLSFLGQKADGLKSPQLQSATQIVQQYQNRLQITNIIKQEIQQRERLLKEQLEGLGLIKEFKSINKEVYYYQQQLAEYKAALNDPRKLEEKAIKLLSQTKLFQNFMQKNSTLASLFRIPDSNDPTAFSDNPGAQTRNSVQQLMSDRFGSMAGSATGVSPQQYMQQQIRAAKPQLDVIKEKLNKLGGSNSDMETPNFKPDNQKTKSFFKRLEYGINIQSQRSTGLLPVTTDFAVTFGYKISDKMASGMGLVYKMGWGQDISHISITHQGVVIRSYFDAQIKGGIWASGGFEYNYMQEFQKWNDISSVDVWQKSCLVGLTKKYKIGKRENKVQVLWDFLSYYQVPRSQPFKFRIGYNFR